MFTLINVDSRYCTLYKSFRFGPALTPSNFMYSFGQGWVGLSHPPSPETILFRDVPHQEIAIRLANIYFTHGLSMVTKI